MNPGAANRWRMPRPRADRHLALDGIENFRDFGGYPTASGRRVRRGRLWRSASHARATDADLERIASLDLALIVDLRRRNERLRDPSRRHPLHAAEVIDNDLGDEAEDSWLAHIRRSDLSEASFRTYLVEYYRKAPFEDRHIDLFSRWFEALSRIDGPVLVHCAAGKDRTGLIVALTHFLLEVPAEAMIADYLLTNDPERFARRGPQLAAHIAEIAGKVPDEAVLRMAMAVDPAYLETALAAITECCGGVDRYLEQVLGVDESRARAIRAQLLE